MARQRHREPPRCPRRKSPTSLIDSQVVKTTPSVMHKCQAVIVGPQDHEIELIVAILEIVNTPPEDTSPSAPRARAGPVRLALCMCAPSSSMLGAVQWSIVLKSVPCVYHCTVR